MGIVEDLRAKMPWLRSPADTSPPLPVEVTVPLPLPAALDHVDVATSLVVSSVLSTYGVISPRGVEAGIQRYFATEG